MSGSAAATVTVGGRTFTQLFPALLRPQTDEEYADLAADVKAHGVQPPVLVDEHGGVLDGWHRLQAAAEDGLTGVPVAALTGLTDDQKWQRALALNVARR